MTGATYEKREVTTDELTQFPHVVCVCRAGIWSVVRFPRGAQGQYDAHQYAQQVGAQDDTVAIVAAQYREIGRPRAIVAVERELGRS